MAAITVSENGVTIKSYREIHDELAEKMKGIFGRELDLSPSSPDGQLLDLFIYAFSDAVEAIQGAVANLDLSSATGTFLDNLGTLMGQGRIPGEDDDTYRGRLLSATRSGLATYGGMLTYLQGLFGAGVTLSVNDEPTTNSDGIPGHSVSVYIPEDSKATDEEIASAIWRCKPAGIRTYGSSSATISDESGLPQTVYFNRISATSTAYYMRIRFTAYDEEVLPDDYVARIAASVASWALDEYKPGKDIIPQRASVAVYGVSGIEQVVVEVSSDGSSWSTATVPVDASNYAQIPEENIAVEKVTGF